jgi:hypothetical protein
LYFKDSFGYFGQPYYWLADYGYRGDWKVEKVDLILPDSPLRFVPTIEEITEAIQQKRNMVNEMVAVMRAVKPIRPASSELRDAPALHYLFDLNNLNEPIIQ